MGANKFQEIKIDFELSTPSFIRGYNSKPEFRMTSFIGVLRFWWRATNWKNYDTSEKLSHAERELFGGTKRQSLLHFSLKEQKIELKNIQTGEYNKKNKNIRADVKEHIGLKYLSYGIFEDENEEGEFIDSGSSGTISIYYTSLSDEQIESLIIALKALHFFGGLGGNSRDGFGSFNLITEIKIGEEIKFQVPNNLVDVKSQINDLIEKFKADSSREIPPYSAFSESSRVFLTRWNKSAKDILKNYGEKLLNYRSGRYHDFKDDTDLVKNIISKYNSGVISDNDLDIPRRAIFGLPHNYFFVHLSGNPKVTFGLNASDGKDGRRASPLFFKVNKFKAGYIGVALILKSIFLPKDTDFQIKIDDKIVYDKHKKKKFPNFVEKINSLEDRWDPIYKFFLNDQSWEAL